MSAGWRHHRRQPSGGVKLVGALVLVAALIACHDAGAPAEQAESGDAAPVADVPVESVAAELVAAEAEDVAVEGDSAADVAAKDVAVDAELPADLSTEGWTEGAGHSKTLTLAWRVSGGGPVPRNQECSLQVLVREGGEPRPDLKLDVSGYMPAHDHGFVQRPLVSEIGNGRYQVDGLLLHMRGHWQLRFTALAPGMLETVTFELEI